MNLTCPSAGTIGPHGTWKVNNQLFWNKYDALKYASTNGSPDITWNWHDHVWSNYNKALLGTRSLPELYKERAQQLRDTYDYLILSYSGGSDSHNILRTFIDNNIKLDQIFVNWPMSIVNSSKHKPNIYDVTARNLISEWDYTVKPTLDWLAKEHPVIKIEIGDWMEKVTDSNYNEDGFSKVTGHWNAGALARNSNSSKIGVEQFDKGKKVATIYGFEKPLVSADRDFKNAYMQFHDFAMLIATNVTGTFEPFYWSPVLPDLAYEMAYQVYLYYKINPQLREYMWPTWKKIYNFDTVLSVNNSISKKICYSDTWNWSKFQAGKPIASGLRFDRDYFLYEFEDFKRPVEIWKYHYDGFYSGIDKKYLNDGGGIRRTLSNSYWLGEL